MREHQRTNSRPLESVCPKWILSGRHAPAEPTGFWVVLNLLMDFRRIRKKKDEGTTGVSFCAKFVALHLFGGGPPDQIKRPALLLGVGSWLLLPLFPVLLPLLCSALLHPSWIKPARVQVNIRAHRFRPFAGDFASHVVGSLGGSTGRRPTRLGATGTQGGEWWRRPATGYSVLVQARADANQNQGRNVVADPCSPVETSTATKRA